MQQRTARRLLGARVTQCERAPRAQEANYIPIYIPVSDRGHARLNIVKRCVSTCVYVVFARVIYAPVN